MTEETYLEPSPYEADAGEKIGIDPRKLSKSALDALETPKSPIKAIRAKCLDCCCEQHSEVRKCVAFDCSLWPYRMGRNPFHGRAK
jgi:hypothetical protein